MSELRIFYHENDGKLKISKSIDTLKKINLKDIIWIDMNDVSENIESELEQFLKIYIQEDEEIEEIEMSSRYIQTDDSIVANSNFLQDNYVMQPVSFIIKNGILVSVRNTELKSFNETVKKIFVNTSNFPSGYHVMVSLFETRVEYDADMIEDVTDQITNLSKNLNTESDLDQDILLQIKELQEKVMIIRQNIVDKQRVVSNMLKCNFFPEDLIPRLNIILKDINSLFEYTRFDFDRLDYLQDTFLGLVNLQQNNIIKIFTVVSVIFLPPTLIASMYGMNFKYMPELDWKFGYPFSILLMISFTVGVLVFFKRKKWL
ncbi:MAG TPA: magnesium/cobalt transporter CorA [Paludibacteraceae bacterium]|nr:magnesium/cobalt transporter CorA [Paludibacteraceae bacterium]OPZ03288.1 MAG: Magnesium transport protein CorA [Bacteroidetes bacterium ADurb.BinA395]HOF98551.1 magnesium/cobalt transporter CorA [Paludibacteraceae bacterium]HOJ65393.1 magnesium/cobalt transporter CorA [Paludibacteraceae bacterium]HOL30322.1 magnesium/cobalt transporter CorA [Paludibacteraceae bacterium]